MNETTFANAVKPVDLQLSRHPLLSLVKKQHLMFPLIKNPGSVDTTIKGMWKKINFTSNGNFHC